MKKFKILLPIILLLLMTLFISCAKEDEVNVTMARTKTVEVKEVQTTNETLFMEYYGYVESGKVTKISFKSSGVLSEINYKTGDIIKKGDLIAKLDESDYKYQLDAASDGINALSYNLNKAKEAYDNAKKDYEDFKRLYEEGAISKSDLDKAELKMTVSKNDYNAVIEQKNQAENNYSALSKSFDDLDLISSVDGIVVDVLYEENESVPAGYPVIVVRSNDLVFKTSVAQKDLNKIDLNDSVILVIGENEYSGIVSDKSNTPDQRTRTYEIEISLNDEISLGSVGNAKFALENISGIKIPLETVIKGSKDYVFVAIDNKAVKKEVVVKKLVGNEVYVEGLSPGDSLIIKGFTRLNDNENINIIND